MLKKMLKFSLMIGGILMLLGLAVYQLGAGSRYAQQLQQKHDSEVILYSAAWCPYCDAVRAHFNQQGQAFVEFDMELDPQAAQEFSQFGGHGVPLVVAKGEVVRGFNRPELNRILNTQSQN